MLRIKEICKQKEITYKVLAERMGVTPEQISRIISSKGNPELRTLISIANALEIEISELFENKSNINGYLDYAGRIYRINSKAELKKVYKIIFPEKTDDSSKILIDDLKAFIYGHKNKLPINFTADQLYEYFIK